MKSFNVCVGRSAFFMSEFFLSSSCFGDFLSLVANRNFLTTRKKKVVGKILHEIMSMSFQKHPLSLENTLSTLRVNFRESKYQHHCQINLFRERFIKCLL